MPLPNLLEEQQKKYGLGFMNPDLPSTDLNFPVGSEVNAISPITPIKPAPSMIKPPSQVGGLDEAKKNELYASILANYEKVSGDANKEYVKEKDLAKDAQMWNEIGRAAAKGGNAYAESIGGANFDTSGFDRIGSNIKDRLSLADRERKEAVENYLMGEKIKSSRLTSKQDDQITKQMNDPNSPLSIRARQLSKAMNPDIDVPEGMTGAEVEKLLPYDQKMYQVREGGVNQFRDLLFDREKFSAQLENQRTLSDRDYNLDLMKMSADQAKLRNAPSKAQEAVDKKYADDYVFWSKEGRPLAQEAIRELEAGKEKLLRLKKEGKWISGKGIGFLPDVMKNQEVNDVRARLEDSAVKGIKAMMAGATSDRDIQTAKETIFNPSGSVESNINRIETEIRKIKAKAQANEKMAKEYEEKGTLKDFSASGASNQSDKPSWAE